MNLPEYAAATEIRPVDFQRKLAEAGAPLKHETVRRWLNGTLPPSHKWMDAIEKATGGHVSRHDVRPDIFGPKPSKAA